MYHRVGANPYGFKNVSVDAFRDQMRWLREHCTPIHPSELRQQAATGGRLKPPVLVTFDDGYRDYLEVASPILREFRIPAVNFISTLYADTGALFWWDVVHLAVEASTRHSVSLPYEREAIPLTRAGRTAAKLAIRRQIWSRPDAERESTLDAFLDALDVKRADLACDRQVMTWDEIRQTTEWTTVGGHTHSHPLMSRIGTAALHDEVRTCRSRIAAEVGTAPTEFAYPAGAVTEEAKSVLRHHGFDTAYSNTQGINNGTIDWMAVRRMHVPDAAEQLRFMLSGLWSDRRPRQSP